MSDVTAFNNCMSVFWRQHEAELSRFLTSKTGDSEKQQTFCKSYSCVPALIQTVSAKWRIREPGCIGRRGIC